MIYTVYEHLEENEKASSTVSWNHILLTHIYQIHNRIGKSYEDEKKEGRKLELVKLKSRKEVRS